MKAWWKVHDKPRGRWRPLLEWGVTLTPHERAEAEELSVRLDIPFCFLLQGGYLGVCSRSGEKRIVVSFPDQLFQQDARKEESGYAYLRYRLCNTCPYSLSKGREYSTLQVVNEYWRARLPWRPGRRPDYSDFVEPVREFLRQVLEELERRFAEARESAPSDEWLLEEEFDSFSRRTLDSGVEVAERKLRVIRR